MVSFAGEGQRLVAELVECVVGDQVLSGKIFILLRINAQCLLLNFVFDIFESYAALIVFNRFLTLIVPFGFAFLREQDCRLDGKR